MKKKGLIIGIDYSDEYCQACFFSERHNRPESISTGEENLRYLFPVALCFNDEKKCWEIGKQAIEYSERNRAFLFTHFLENAIRKEACFINEFEYTYVQLFAIFIGKLIEYIQIATAVMNIENITVNMRDIDYEKKQIIFDTFEYLKIPEEKIKLQTCAESFAYYVLNENPDFWNNGTLLFDFSQEGFFEKELSVRKQNGDSLVYVTENDCSLEFNIDELKNADELDNKLLALYQELVSEGFVTSVFLTGQGFEEIWFKEALKGISETARVFRGNILYAKGACLAGYIRAQEDIPDYKVLCDGKTMVIISTSVNHQGVDILVNLSNAPVNWFDAGIKKEFILDNTDKIVFYIKSLISRERTSVEFDLSQFPKRPNKTTRVEIEIKYTSATDCSIVVRDLGFGRLFPSSNKSVAKSIDLKGYI